MQNPAPDIPVEIPWGKDRLSMQLPAGWELLGVMQPSACAVPEDIHQEIERSLSEPTGLPRLSEWSAETPFRPTEKAFKRAAKSMAQPSRRWQILSSAVPIPWTAIYAKV